MLVKVVPLGDDCHCMLPVFPANVIVVAEPEQSILLVAVTAPPTECGLTATVSIVELAEAHIPLVTTAR